MMSFTTMLHYCTQGEASNPAIITIHGLFGSLANVRPISQPLAKDYYSITVDCRNHGYSFHNDSMTYAEMSRDICDVMTHLGVPKATIIGHSMGGKIAMACGLYYPDKVTRIVSIDIAPKHYPPYHLGIMNALLNTLSLQAFSSKTAVSDHLAAHIPNPALRQFLVKSIAKNPDGSLHWLFNIPAIHHNYATITQFMDHPPSRIPILFIQGTRSEYISSADYPHIYAQFPNATIQSMDTSHWVHAENPKETLTNIQNFLNN
jgi:esterase